MMYKVKKYYPKGTDRRQILESGYAKAHAVGVSSDQYAKQDFWPMLQGQLHKEKRYLDAGCGIGGWVLFLSERGYQVEGVDEAARVLRAMTEYNPDIALKQGQLTALPYANDSFDGLLSVGSLDHEEDDLAKALKEMARVIKPHGLLFLEVPLLNTLRRFKYVPLKRLEALVRRTLGHHEVFAGYLFDRDSLSELLAEAGFEVKEMQAHDLPSESGHYGLYVDWPWLRGSKPYHLNILGKLAKIIYNAISPWVASTGVVVVAKKIAS